MSTPFGFRWFTVGFRWKKDLLQSCLYANYTKTTWFAFGFVVYVGFSKEPFHHKVTNYLLHIASIDYFLFLTNRLYVFQNFR